jgi:hypothetical protein
LDRPHHAHNFSSSKICAPETIQIGSAFGDFLLKSRGVDHHVDCFVGIKVGLPVQGGQTEQRFLSVFEPTFSNKPPWTFWGEEDTDKEWNWPPARGLATHWE